MPSLKGTKTFGNLKEAFAGESQANRRYLYFAQKADVEGYNDVAAVFRSTAEGETGHAHGHLEYLEEVGDPATGEPATLRRLTMTQYERTLRDLITWAAPGDAAAITSALESSLAALPVDRPERTPQDLHGKDLLDAGFETQETQHFCAIHVDDPDTADAFHQVPDDRQAAEAGRLADLRQADERQRT